MAYKLSEKAVNDIIEFYLNCVEQFGSVQAEFYHASLENVFLLLGENPELAREREELNPHIRIHPHGSHLILYRIDDGQDVIILTIRHAREDWQDGEF